MNKRSNLRLGIDVGGTHTDAALLDSRNNLLYAIKTQTTPDVTEGIFVALEEVVKNSGIDPEEVSAVMFGTTHCTNAIVERKGLAKIGVIRLGSPATHAIRPLRPLPKELAEKIGNVWTILPGGHEFDGREISKLDEGKVSNAAKLMKSENVEAIAISAVFSPVNSSHERRAREIIEQEYPKNFHITLSHEIGTIGLLERENAAVLNAALVNVAKRAVNAFKEAIRRVHLIKSKIFLTQNDGSLMTTDYALKYPVKTVSSGPTNSIRGAGFLTGMKDTVVVDVGGTTTLVGVLANGFPRESAVAAEIGGVRTNFRMPDLLAVGCGGGTIVKSNHAGDIALGPESLGYNLVKESVAFGGSTITTTDIALASGYATISDKRIDKSRLELLDDRFVNGAKDKIINIIEQSIEKMKTKTDPVPVVLVGGGGIILPPSSYNKMSGVSKVVRPNNFQYANAIGAAIAQVGGELDRVFSLENLDRKSALDQAKRLATEDAIKAGARPNTVEIVDVEEIPLSYLPGNAIRLRVKAVGKLAL
jgi:N-methylhydantoinase A/oxoprolinase/acetone carboxylase beta subunit